MLVLIVLAIGALTVVPTLQHTYTATKFRQVIAKDVRAMYAAEGAQEYVKWKFIYDNLGASLVNDGDNVTIPVNVCGISVDCFIVVKAQETVGPVAFATKHVIRPLKTVSPNTVDNDTPTYHTYTINLEQLSANTTQGLDAVYDVLPAGFDEEDYIEGSSKISINGGSWQSIADPEVEVEAGQVRLLWPATYKYQNGTGGFTPPFSDFFVRQVKELKYDIYGELPKNKLHASWIVLKPWDTLSGPVGPIEVGTPNPPGIMDGGLILTYITSNPQIIQPGVETDIEYTVHMTNVDGETLSIEKIQNWLPPQFTYTDNSTSGITEFNPVEILVNGNNQERWLLEWTYDELPGGTISIASAETLTLTFWAWASKDVSGTYYSEAFALVDKPPPTILRKIGVTEEEYVTNYTWNTAAVVVPNYDSSADAGDATIDANLAIVPGGVAFVSWQIR